MTKLSGYEAIEMKEFDPDVVLCMYNSPIEDAREGLTIEEAEDIAAQDPGLIWCEVPDVPASIGRRRSLGARP